MTAINFIEKLKIIELDTDPYEYYIKLRQFSNVQNEIRMNEWKRAGKAYFHDSRIVSVGVCINYDGKEMKKRPFDNQYPCECFLFVELANGEHYLLGDDDTGDLLING